MNKILGLVALCTVIAAPAFAQSTPKAQQWSSTVHMYAADHYARTQSINGNKNKNLNPDFQLGGDN